MISDWSGVAYEFAFATGKPVLFVDVPQKMNEARERSVDLPAMEMVCRTEIGLLTTVERLHQDLEQVLSEPELWSKKIEEARARYLYNFGNSKRVAVERIWELANA